MKYSFNIYDYFRLYKLLNDFKKVLLFIVYMY